MTVSRRIKRYTQQADLTSVLYLFVVLCARPQYFLLYFNKPQTKINTQCNFFRLKKCHKKTYTYVFIFFFIFVPAEVLEKESEPEILPVMQRFRC